MIIAAAWYESAGSIVGALVAFVALILIPAYWFLHRKVIKPLSFVLGLKQEDSPTGTAIPNIPMQLAAIRAELHPNGGSSMRDSIDRNERSVQQVNLRLVDLDQAIRTHVAEDAASFGIINKTLNALLAGQLSAARAALLVKDAIDKSEADKIVAREAAKRANLEMAAALRAEGTPMSLAAALLLERAEGRRILLSKPNPTDRTPEEQYYVDLLEDESPPAGQVREP